MKSYRLISLCTMSTLETQLAVDRLHYLRLGLIVVLQLSTSFFFFSLELWEELTKCSSLAKLQPLQKE